MTIEITSLYIISREASKAMPCYVCDGSNGGRSSGASIFVGGFVLGGLIVGAIGCVYAPQVIMICQ